MPKKASDKVVQDLRDDLTLLAKQYLILSVVVNLLIKKTGITKDEYDTAVKDAIGNHLEGKLLRPEAAGSSSSDSGEQQPGIPGAEGGRVDSNSLRSDEQGTTGRSQEESSTGN